jgi:hypothetical protein
MATINLLLVVAIFLPACGAQPAPRSVDGTRIEAVVQSARVDAALRSGLPVRQIAVLTAQSVTWADGSLGCPRAGVLSTQALVPGYRVTLRVGATLWDYHAGDRGGLVLCPAGQAQEQEPAPGGLD